MFRGSIYQRGRAWWYRFQVHGVVYAGNTHAPTKTLAQIVLIQKITEVCEQLDVDRRKAPAAPELTLEEAALLWPQADGIDRQRVMRWIAAMGAESRVSSIDHRRLSKWLAARAESCSPNTARREAAAVSGFLSWCVTKEFIAANPMRNATKPKGTRARLDPISPEQVAAALLAVRGHPTLEPATLLAVFAGLRRGELVGVRWQDVDLERGTLLVRGRKTADSYATVPLHEELLAWLREHERKSGPVVRGVRGRELTAHALEVVRSRFEARLPTWHSYRHFFATELVRSGVRMESVSRLLRHASPRVTADYYAHLQPVDCRDDLAALRIPKSKESDKP